MKKAIHTASAPAAIGPYSQATEANGLIFISGQLPLDQATGVIPSDVAEQAHQCMKNIGFILEEAGMSFDNLLRCTVFLKSMDDFSAVNEVYASYLKEPYPARAAVEVARLPRDVFIEIDAFAIRG